MACLTGEIVLSGSVDGAKWTEYSWKYKAGDINTRPALRPGHMPRLDWRMCNKRMPLGLVRGVAPPDWFDRFVGRLLEGSPHVLGLMERDPFGPAEHERPRLIKVDIYDYRFVGSANATEPFVKGQKGQPAPNAWEQGTAWQRRFVKAVKMYAADSRGFADGGSQCPPGEGRALATGLAPAPAARACVRVLRKEDQEPAVKIFTDGLLQYAVEGSAVLFMEHSFLERTLGTDMKDIHAHYVLGGSGRNFWVAVLGGKVIGVVAGAVSEDGESVELCRMSVAAASRGMGAGAMLVKQVIHWASGLEGVSKVKLGTLNVKRAAIRLYERHGFRLTGCKRLGQDFFNENENGMEGAVVGNEVIEIRSYELEIV